MPISRASDQAGPMNDTPTGRPRTNPAGTVMCGYPATDVTVDGADEFAKELSPFTRSVSHAGPPLGASSASTFLLAKTRSSPSVRDSRAALAFAAR